MTAVAPFRIRSVFADAASRFVCIGRTPVKRSALACAVLREHLAAPGAAAVWVSLGEDPREDRATARLFTVEHPAPAVDAGSSLLNFVPARDLHPDHPAAVVNNRLLLDTSLRFLDCLEALLAETGLPEGADSAGRPCGAVAEDEYPAALRALSAVRHAWARGQSAGAADFLARLRAEEIYPAPELSRRVQDAVACAGRPMPAVSASRGGRAVLVHLRASGPGDRERRVAAALMLWEAWRRLLASPPADRKLIYLDGLDRHLGPGAVHCLQNFLHCARQLNAAVGFGLASPREANLPHVWAPIAARAAARYVSDWAGVTEDELATTGIRCAADDIRRLDRSKAFAHTSARQWFLRLERLAAAG